MMLHSTTTQREYMLHLMTVRVKIEFDLALTTSATDIVEAFDKVSLVKDLAVDVAAHVVLAKD
jgi:hypothetical protein